ncbi:hypothetical protein V8G54_001431, partial [Vigna mungo]
TNSLESLEFIGFEGVTSSVTSCSAGGLDSWTLPGSSMAFSLLEYTRLFPNFPSPSGVGLTGSGAGSIPPSISGTTMPFVPPISGPNVMFWKGVENICIPFVW